MELYLKSGYLDQEAIEKYADANHVNFIIEIGARQVGKTYGTLKLMLDKKEPFILMRRTGTEAEFISSPVNHPFIPYGIDVEIENDSKYTAAVSTPEDGLICEIMALSTVAKIRGFNAQIFKNVIYDEFIPENHVQRMKLEGDAFLNAYVTINGAREEQGKKPVRFWLLANANTLSSPILAALKVTNDVEKMIRAGQEMKMIKDRGILIIIPKSEKITDKRRKSALYKAIGTESDFARMSLNNEFSYNDLSDIKPVPVSRLNLIYKIAGMGIYRIKDGSGYYVGEKAIGTVKGTNVLQGTEADKAYIKNHLSFIKRSFIDKNITFENASVKTRLLDIVL